MIPRLVAAGRRVIVPSTSAGTGPPVSWTWPRPDPGQQAAIGKDVLGLLDALGIPRAVLAGFDWGGRAACVAAALWPGRCTGVVSVNGHLIPDIDSAMTPIRPDLEAGLWYFFLLLNLGPDRHPGRTGRWQLPGLMTGSWHLPSLLVHVSERRHPVACKEHRTCTGTQHRPFDWDGRESTYLPCNRGGRGCRLGRDSSRRWPSNQGTRGAEGRDSK